MPNGVCVHVAGDAGAAFRADADEELRLRVDERREVVDRPREPTLHRRIGERGSRDGCAVGTGRRHVEGVHVALEEGVRRELHLEPTKCGAWGQAVPRGIDRVVWAVDSMHAPVGHVGGVRCSHPFDAQAVARQRLGARRVRSGWHVDEAQWRAGVRLGERRCAGWPHCRHAEEHLRSYVWTLLAWAG